MICTFVFIKENNKSIYPHNLDLKCFWAWASFTDSCHHLRYSTVINSLSHIPFTFYLRYSTVINSLSHIPFTFYLRYSTVINSLSHIPFTLYLQPYYKHLYEAYLLFLCFFLAVIFHVFPQRAGVCVFLTTTNHRARIRLL